MEIIVVHCCSSLPIRVANGFSGSSLHLRARMERPLLSPSVAVYGTVGCAQSELILVKPLVKAKSQLTVSAGGGGLSIPRWYRLHQEQSCGGGSKRLSVFLPGSTWFWRELDGIQIRPESFDCWKALMVSEPSPRNKSCFSMSPKCSTHCPSARKKDTCPPTSLDCRDKRTVVPSVWAPTQEPCKENNLLCFPLLAPLLFLGCLCARVSRPGLGLPGLVPFFASWWLSLVGASGLCVPGAVLWGCCCCFPLQGRRPEDRFFFRRYSLRCSGTLVLCIKSHASAGLLVVCVVTDQMVGDRQSPNTGEGRDRVPPQPTIACRSRRLVVRVVMNRGQCTKWPVLYFQTGVVSYALSWQP